MPKTLTTPRLQITHAKILDKLPGLVALYNIHTGRYDYVNNALKRLLGYDPQEFTDNGLGFVSSLVHPDDAQRVTKENYLALGMANAVGNFADKEPIVSFEYRMRHVEGHWVWLHTQGTVFDRDVDNSVKNVLNISIDITKRKANEERLLARSSELEHRVEQHAERLDLALEATNTGTWEWNIETGTLVWSPEMMRLYGMDPDKEAITYEKFMASLHPDDREMKQQILMSAAKTGQAYQAEHRCIWPDGSLHWIQGRGKAYMKNGQAYRMVGTAINIDEHKAAEKLKIKTSLLKAERNELRALNKAKDEFISLASHQLRTPATGVKQYVGMLIDNFAGKPNPKQAELLHKAYESNERQIKIVNDLLLVAKVDAGKVTLNKQLCDIGQLIRDVVGEHMPILKHRQQKMRLKLTPALTVMADVFYLRTVLENLLNNASKYSPHGKQIVITALKTDADIKIEISDHGIGIRAQDHTKLFRKFTRIYNDQAEAVDGNGLGLYWSKKIIDLHKGTLTLVSELDKGSTFTITLPKK